MTTGVNNDNHVTITENRTFCICKFSWQEWLDEDRTFLSVNENAILGYGKDAEIGGAQC